MSRSSAALILERVAAAGLSVSVHGDRLLVTPPGQLPDDLRAQLQAFKPAILRWLSWDEQAARDALDAALDRIGRVAVNLDGFGRDQQRVDGEERINVAGHHRDWDAYQAAIAAYEEHCLRVYGRAEAPA